MWTVKGDETYRSGDDESGEEIPDGIECRRNDWCNVVVRCEANSHHAVECEVEQREVHEEEVPEEFGSCPLKPNHRVNYDPIYGSLNKCVWKFNDNLQQRSLS